MRLLRLLVLPTLLLTCSVSSADDGLDVLENLLKSQNSDTIRIQTFLTKKKVKNPVYYAKIITKKIHDNRTRNLFAAKLVVETRGKANAVSPKGAIGPWQVMPMWCKTLHVSASELRNPEKNLEAAVRVHKIHLSQASNRVWGHKGSVWRYGGGSDYYVKIVRENYEEVATL